MYTGLPLSRQLSHRTARPGALIEHLFGDWSSQSKIVWNLGILSNARSRDTVASAAPPAAQDNRTLVRGICRRQHEESNTSSCEKLIMNARPPFPSPTDDLAKFSKCLSKSHSILASDLRKLARTPVRAIPSQWLGIGGNGASRTPVRGESNHLLLKIILVDLAEHSFEDGV